MNIKVIACKCEKIPEREFDEHPELNEDWEELYRKDGYVYIGFYPNIHSDPNPSADSGR